MPDKRLGGYKGHAMAGYTPAPIAKGKYDDIYARAVLIEQVRLGNIKKYTLLISMDFCQIPLLFSDYIKEKIEERFRIYRNQILVHTTHTHKSYDLMGLFSRGGGWPSIIRGIINGSYTPWNDKYRVWITKRIVRLVEKLLGKLVEAEVAWKTKIFDEWIATDRVNHVKADKPINIMLFRNKDTKRTIGVIVNFGAHPTTLHGRDPNVSADYPGRVVYYLEKFLNANENINIENSEGDQVESGHNDERPNSDNTHDKERIEVNFFTGAAGDIAPSFKLFLNQMTKKKDGLIFLRHPYWFTRNYGKKIAELAFTLLKEFKDGDFIRDIDIKIYTKTFWVPMKDYRKYKVNPFVSLVNFFYYFVKRHFLIPLALALADVKEPNFPGVALKHKKHKIMIYSYIQLIQIREITPKGNNKEDEEAGKEEEKENNKTHQRSLGILGVPGELFTYYAEKMRQNSGLNNLFIFQSSNDWIAYLFPLKHYLTKGGYEPMASFAPMCGAYVYNNYNLLLKEIKEGLTGGHF
ncbi:MAG: hypothetical protein ACTSU2_16205 [Promethearchaeota archaeon]